MLIKPRFDLAKEAGMYFSSTLALDVAINPFQIIEKTGYKLVFGDLEGEEGYCIRYKGKYCICLDKRVHKNRQKFTAMHEISHILLNHHGTEAKSHKILDLEADTFSGEVLMPKKDILNCNLHTIVDLSKHFEVSAMAMRTRLKFLGMLDILSYKKPTKQMCLDNLLNVSKYMKGLDI